ncbi:MAG: 3-deoxy-D-manno-octulosonic acid transferase [Bacteroidaceae bacterium]|nr:3-deoxy-D-manno-octulosonic acid transferase [Bacteroidaceae bacterium]
MMYTLIIFLYSLGAHIAALFNKKVRLMIKGQHETFGKLRREIDPNGYYVWVHAASLGEFEQGRPLIERIRAEHPHIKVLLTFFSPSGYEVRKNYEGADLICYLPFDTPLNARRFVKMANVKMAFFIKYEFWRNYIGALHRNGIPVYSVSSIFRPDQIFFRWYGKGYARCLRRITHFFVQNDTSIELLKTLGITVVTKTGDTRFDRVLDIMHQAKELPIVEAFAKGKKVLIAGSSWAPDEDLFIPYFNNHKELKLVIAPHVVNEAHISEIERKLGRPSLRYSKATPEEAAKADCLIIDCYGLLSSIYRYATVAYVGGGFGVGIHNVPEAAVYGCPVLFGPNNKKFKEAQDLIACKGSYEIHNEAEFTDVLTKLLTYDELLRSSGAAASSYIRDNAGARDAIYKSISNLLN